MSLFTSEVREEGACTLFRASEVNMGTYICFNYNMPAPAPKTHWFILGRESLIAAAEIGAVLSVPAAAGSRLTVGKNSSSQILKVDGLFCNSPLGRGRGGLAGSSE